MRDEYVIKQQSAVKQFFKEIFKNKVLFLMLLPGTLILFFINYLPMAGIIIAFKSIDYAKGFFGGDWIGFKNFEFFLATPDAFVITRNTVLYNLAFIIVGLVVSVFFAIILNELVNRKLARLYQSTMFLPYFLSWIVVSYLAFAFFSAEFGFVNSTILAPLGVEPIQWYTEPKYWPFILTFFNIWKYTGYNSVIYLASIVGIDTEYYEAAAIDGASRWQQIKHITLPMLTPLMVILTLLAVGRIFNADFGLFFQVTRNQGALFDTTNVIDTYVYRALMNSGDIGMASAAGLYQAVVGFILVFGSNFIVRKIDKEKALF
jgi:putative aldouronate transport system permease protein